MNSTIEYSPEERMSYLNKRVASLEERLAHNTVDPNNVTAVRKMAQKAISNVPAPIDTLLLHQHY